MVSWIQFHETIHSDQTQLHYVHPDLISLSHLVFRCIFPRNRECLPVIHWCLVFAYLRKNHSAISAIRFYLLPNISPILLLLTDSNHTFLSIHAKLQFQESSNANSGKHFFSQDHITTQYLIEEILVYSFLRKGTEKFSIFITILMTLLYEVIAY